MAADHLAQLALATTLHELYEENDSDYPEMPEFEQALIMLPRDRRLQGQGHQQFVCHNRPQGHSPRARSQMIRGQGFFESQIPQDGARFQCQTARPPSLLDIQLYGRQNFNPIPEAQQRQFQGCRNAAFNQPQLSQQWRGRVQGQIGATNLGQQSLLSNEEQQDFRQNERRWIQSHQDCRFRSNSSQRLFSMNRNEFANSNEAQQRYGVFQGQRGTANSGFQRSYSNEEQQAFRPIQEKQISSHKDGGFRSSPTRRSSSLVRIGFEDSSKQKVNTTRQLSPMSSPRMSSNCKKTEKEPTTNYKHSPRNKSKAKENLVVVKVSCISDDKRTDVSDQRPTAKHESSNTGVSTDVTGCDVPESTASATHSTCSISDRKIVETEVISASIAVPDRKITVSIDVIGGDCYKEENKNKTEDKTRDTSKKTEDTCCKTDDLCKQTVDISNKTEDISSKTEDTCLRRRVKRVSSSNNAGQTDTQEESYTAKFNLKPMTVALTRLDIGTARNDASVFQTKHSVTKTKLPVGCNTTESVCVNQDRLNKERTSAEDDVANVALDGATVPLVKNDVVSTELEKVAVAASVEKDIVRTELDKDTKGVPAKKDDVRTELEKVTVASAEIDVVRTELEKVLVVSADNDVVRNELDKVVIAPTEANVVRTELEKVSAASADNDGVRIELEKVTDVPAEIDVERTDLDEITGTVAENDIGNDLDDDVTGTSDKIAVEADLEETVVTANCSEDTVDMMAGDSSNITDPDDDIKTESIVKAEGDGLITMASQQMQHQENLHHLSVQKGGGDCPDVEMKGVETLEDENRGNKDSDVIKAEGTHGAADVRRDGKLVHGRVEFEPSNTKGGEIFAHESKLSKDDVGSVDYKHKHNFVNSLEMGKENSGVKQEQGAGKIDVERASLTVQQEVREKFTPDKAVPEKRPPKERQSPTSFLDFADDDEDDNDESDDDFLGTAPAFLKSIEQLTGRPLPKTPERSVFNSSHSSGVSDANDVSMEYHSPLGLKKRPLPHGRSKFTLDHLLADHMDNFEHEAEMDEIKSELQAGIQQGGFVNILNKEEEAPTDLPLPDAQQEVLRHFHVEESHICDFRPGVEVLLPRHYLCLFDSTIRPADCGFKAVANTHLEKRLATVMPGQYQRLLSGPTSVIPLLFNKLPCQAALLRWLFYLLSVERNHLTRVGCQTVLLEILHKHHTTVKCFPGLYDLISVLINYGAQLETLVPSDLGSIEQIRSRLHHQPEYQPPAAAGSQQGGGDGAQLEGFQRTNLFMVLDFLALSLYRNSVTMTADELDLLLAVLCKASLDSSLKSSCGVEAFSKCIALTVRQYTEEDWQTHRCRLCGMLVRLSDHHHDMASLAQLLPKTGSRGSYLRRAVGFLMLVRLILDDDSANEEGLGDVQIRDLHILVGPMKDLLIEDPYKLSSVVTILDICVGINTSLKSSEREELKTLIELVHSIRVRDNVGMLDRTRVKDMLVRLTSSWSLDIQTMKGKQTKIFEYAVHDSPVKMKIEAVETSQVEEDSTSDSQSDDDENGELPHKIQRLLPDSKQIT